jgi:hypothetical protein
MTQSVINVGLQPDDGLGDPVRTAFQKINANIAELYKIARPTGVIFASLPSPILGMVQVVTDSTTTTWGAIISGGGANPVLAWYNGTNWTVVGK